MDGDKKKGDMSSQGGRRKSSMAEYQIVKFELIPMLVYKRNRSVKLIPMSLYKRNSVEKPISMSVYKRNSAEKPISMSVYKRNNSQKWRI